MKKILIILFTIGYPMLIFSQVNIGFDAGIGFKNVIFNPLPPNLNVQIKPTYSVGVSSMYSFNNLFAIATGISFNEKNFHYTSFINYSSDLNDNTKIINYENNYQLIYGEVPINIGIFKDVGKYRLSFFSGVYFSYNIFNKGNFMAENGVEFKINFLDYYHKQDIGYNFLIGIEYKSVSLKTYYKRSLFNLALDNNYQVRFGEVGILLSYNLLNLKQKNNEK